MLTLPQDIWIVPLPTRVSGRPVGASVKVVRCARTLLGVKLVVTWPTVLIVRDTRGLIMVPEVIVLISP